MKTIADYLKLIPPEHAGAADFVASLTAVVQPLVDMQNLCETINGLFDLDEAVGQQLDTVGQWIGRTRYLNVPLDIYFSVGVPNLGLGQGILRPPYTNATGISVLPDDQYRTLLRATIAANFWDGTVPGAYAAWNTLFANTPFSILIQDYGNMTMGFALIGAQPDPITQALFTSGELALKPAGVTLYNILPTVWPAGTVNGVVGTPLFGLGVDNANIGGLGHGALAQFISKE